MSFADFLLGKSIHKNTKRLLQSVKTKQIFTHEQNIACAVNLHGNKQKCKNKLKACIATRARFGVKLTICSLKVVLIARVWHIIINLKYVCTHKRQGIAINTRQWYNFQPHLLNHAVYKYFRQRYCIDKETWTNFITNKNFVILFHRFQLFLDKFK